MLEPDSLDSANQEELQAGTTASRNSKPSSHEDNDQNHSSSAEPSTKQTQSHKDNGVDSLYTHTSSLEQDSDEIESSSESLFLDQDGIHESILEQSSTDEATDASDSVVGENGRIKRNQVKKEKKRAKKERRRETRRSYKAKQEETIKNIAIGNQDEQNECITNVFAKGEDYVIYEVGEKEWIKTLIHTKKKSDKRIIDRFKKIEPNYIKIKSLIHKVDNNYIFKSQLASIVSHALSDDDNKANDLLEDLIKDINTEFDDRVFNKFAFLYCNIIICVILSGISLCFYHNSTLSNSYINYNFDAFSTLSFILTCASIGGTFSLARKSKKLATIKGLKWKTYMLYGIERTFVSLSAGFILFIAIKAHIIFASIMDISKPEQRLFSILFFSVAAGFSETLVPDLLVSIEKKTEKDQS